MSSTVPSPDLVEIAVLLDQGKWSEAEGLLSHQLLAHELDAQLHDLLGYAQGIYRNSIWHLSGPGLLRRVVFAEGEAAMEQGGLWALMAGLA